MYSKSQQIKRQPKEKKKKVSITKIKNKCVELAKEIVKIRDKNTCQRCGKVVFGVNCQASHVAPVSSGNILIADPLNIKVLCYHCHLNWWHKDPTVSGKWFKDKFPERHAYIEAHRYESVKRTYQDWQDIYDNLKHIKETL